MQIFINGHECEVEAGSMIIEAADCAHINIPRFCYHKKLSVAANCRMCLVDVEKSGKPLPACATPVVEGMKVWTRTPKAIEAQKSVMEFLLINHPLDCPICDQAGECELQDMAMGFGRDVSRYSEKKRVVIDEDLGPLIATDMTRCIHCTRCVRFGTEIAGIREMGATGRGEHMRIGTYIAHTVQSEVSGNMIDVCPVGALTSKPYQYRARGWELSQAPGVAVHDCLGSHIFFHTRRDQVMRVVPKEFEAINEVWLSDRDRFSYTAFDKGRLQHPMVKKDGHWQQVPWLEALNTASQLLKAQAPEKLGFLSSPNASLEEYYLLQKLARSLKTNNLDYRLRQQDFAHQAMAPSYPSLGVPLAELNTQTAILLIGSHIRQEQPLAALRLRQAALNGAKICAINPYPGDYNFDCTQWCPPQANLVQGLKTLLEHLHKDEPAPPELADLLAELREAQNLLIIMGPQALHHPQASQIWREAQLLQKHLSARLGELNEGANHAGAALAGFLPHRGPGGRKLEQVGLSSADMWRTPDMSYVLFGFEPDLDTADGRQALAGLQSARSVIAVSSFENQALLDYADVLLPQTLFAEQTGSYINCEGRVQTSQAAVSAPFETKPGWKIIRALANCLELADFEQVSVAEIKSEFEAEQGDYVLDWSEVTATERRAPSGLIRLGPTSQQHLDPILRRAEPLQARSGATRNAYMHPKTIEKLKLGAEVLAKAEVKDPGVRLDLLPDLNLPEGTVLIYSGVAETAQLNAPFQSIVLEAL